MYSHSISSIQQQSYSTSPYLPFSPPYSNEVTVPLHNAQNSLTTTTVCLPPLNPNTFAANTLFSFSPTLVEGKPGSSRACSRCCLASPGCENTSARRGLHSDSISERWASPPTLKMRARERGAAKAPRTERGGTRQGGREWAVRGLVRPSKVSYISRAVSVGYMQRRPSGEDRDEKGAYEEVAGVALQHGRIAYHAVDDKLQDSGDFLVRGREQNIYVTD
jgi:hypothetical protein